jgi:NAD+ synthase
MFDAASEAARVSAWLRDQAAGAQVDGFVYGLSGGIDSAVVAGLTERALPGRNLAVILPCHSQPEDVADAYLAVREMGLTAVEVDLSPVCDLLTAQIVAAGGDAPPGSGDGRRSQLAAANLKARLRMAAMYYFANRRGALVAGGGNRSELTVGYFTKFGDGGCDLLPIGHLVKWQVRALARVLGVPARIISRAPTAGLWPGQTDEAELGFSYRDLDHFILTGEGPEHVVSRIREMHAASEHKRKPPPTPGPPAGIADAPGRIGWKGTE